MTPQRKEPASRSRGWSRREGMREGRRALGWRAFLRGLRGSDVKGRFCEVIYAFGFAQVKGASLDSSRVQEEAMLVSKVLGRRREGEGSITPLA